MSEYKRLDALTVSVRVKGIPYIRCDELTAKLGPGKSREFDSLFGIQTCPVIEAETKKNGDHAGCLYPWDAEAVLERMASGERTGSQLHWD